MYNLKAFFSKLFSQLRIYSEREIRGLQLRQVKHALKQSNISEISATKAQIKYDQILCQRNTPIRNEKEKTPIKLKRPA